MVDRQLANEVMRQLAFAAHDLQLQGLSFTQIGERLNISKGSVAGLIFRHVRRYGEVPPMPPKPRVARPKKKAIVAPEPAVWLRNYSCLWPSGDRPVRFECKAKAEPGKPYCAAHNRIARSGSPFNQRPAA